MVSCPIKKKRKKEEEKKKKKKKKKNVPGGGKYVQNTWFLMQITLNFKEN